MFWLDRAYGWLAAVSVVLVLVGIGDAVLRRFPYERAPLSRLTLGFVAGAAVIVPLLMVLTTALHLGPVLAGVLAVGCLPFGVHGARIVATLRCRRAPLVVALVLLAPYALQTLLPEHDWDGPSYHVPTARMFLARGAWATDSFLAQVNFPGSVHLLYAWLLALGAESALVPFNLLVSLLALLAGAALARDFFGARAAAFTLAVGATNHMLLELGLDTRIDNFLTLWIVVATHALLLWRDAPKAQHAHPGLVLAAGALGLALGTKYSGAVYLLVLAPVTLMGLVAERRASVRLVLLAALAGALPSALWYVRNLVELHDPVYPFRGDRVYQAADGTTASFVPALEALLAKTGPVPADFMQPFPPPFELRANLVDFAEILSDPELYENKPLHFVTPLAPLAFLLAFALRTRAARQLGFVVAVSWAALMFGPPTSRYMLPTFALAAVGAGAVLATISQRTLRRVLVALVAFLIVRQTIFELRKITLYPPLERVANALQWERHPTPQEWLWIERLEPTRYLSGQESEVSWLRRVGYNRATVSPNVAAFLIDEVAAGRANRDERIFAIGEDKQGCIPLPLLADMSRDCFRWLVALVRHGGDHDAVHRDLWNQGVRWFLFNVDYVEWCKRNVAWTTDGDRLKKRDFVFAHWQLARFLEERTRPVHEWPKFARLLRLQPPR